LPVRIRLKRVGSKKNPHYRVVVMPSSKPRDGAAIETLGYYDPRRADGLPVFDNPDRALHWLMTGAQPSETARSLLRKAGIWAKFAEARSAKAEEPKAGGEAEAPAETEPEPEAPAEAEAEPEA
jgi:small subunit ribosomal protein S16